MFPWTTYSHDEKWGSFSGYGSYGGMDVTDTADYRQYTFKNEHSCIGGKILSSDHPAIPMNKPQDVPLPWVDLCMGDIRKQRLDAAAIIHKVRYNGVKWNLPNKRFGTLHTLRQLKQQLRHNDVMEDPFDLLPNNLKKLATDVREYKNCSNIPLANYWYSGGCIKHAVSHTMQDPIYLVFSTGVNNDRIKFQPIQITETDVTFQTNDNVEVELTELDLGENIHEIAVPVAEDQVFCGARLKNQCCLFANKGSGWEHVATETFTSRPTSIAMSQFISGK